MNFGPLSEVPNGADQDPYCDHQSEMIFSTILKCWLSFMAQTGYIFVSTYSLGQE